MNLIKYLKNTNNEWKVCDQRDNTWYNYENGYWATVIISEQELQINDEITLEERKELSQSSPRG